MELQGNFLDYFISFFAGVLVSFTPCVYPLIPITAGFIAGFNTKGTKYSGFFLSLIYVFGMSITYCSFAVAAVLTGKVFGQALNHPLIYSLAAAVLLFFSLVLLDVIKLPVFELVSARKIKKKNIFTVILFGAASGLVVGPCTSPVLGALLVYAGAKQNIFHAVSLIFVFSYGVGFSLILAGTFSGFLARLPKSGKWLVGIKKFCGTILLLTAVYAALKACGFVF